MVKNLSRPKKLLLSKNNSVLNDLTHTTKRLNRIRTLHTYSISTVNMSEMGVPNKVTEVRGNECSPPEVVEVVSSVEESKTEGIDANSSTIDSTLATTTPKKKKKKRVSPEDIIAQVAAAPSADDDAELGDRVAVADTQPKAGPARLGERVGVVQVEGKGAVGGEVFPGVEDKVMGSVGIEYMEASVVYCQRSNAGNVV